MSEELGDDLDLIQPDVLGRVTKSVTDATNTVLQIDDLGIDLDERIKLVEEKIKNETNGYLKKKHEARLAMLNGAVAVVKVSGQSKIEMKEKKDRVEDAIYAVKAALKEGIVPGGGIALLNASLKLNDSSIGESVLKEAIRAPFETILANAGLPVPDNVNFGKNKGIDVVSGKTINMVRHGIIDPVLVTKTALKNAVSVATTILSADCVINNMRLDESN
jgi:chaperonin GroEL (HSP60 family)